VGQVFIQWMKVSIDKGIVSSCVACLEQIKLFVR